MTHNPAPVIAITTTRLSASALPHYPEALQGLSLDYAASDYSRAVIGAGGTPVLIPRDTPPESLLRRIDGLVLSGGEDVTPSLYGAESGPYATTHDPCRDAYELSIISHALRLKIPILAICRGIQILNVARGGTLVAHLSEVDGFAHYKADLAPHVRRHGVVIAPESGLFRTVITGGGGDGTLAVNSFHHQAIDQPGHSLRVVAWADDGTIEGVEDLDAAIIGVQWHPELHEGLDPLFSWLVDTAKNHLARSQKG